MSERRQSLRCELRLEPARPLLEFVAFGPPSLFPATTWPTQPGEVRRCGAGRLALLHFAPSRWLVPAPDAERLALLAAATAEGTGTIFEVDGKWTEFALAGEDAARLLASSLDVAAVLEERGCAAATMFDCPLVLARSPAGFVLWVRASYAVDFAAAVQRLQAGS